MPTYEYRCDACNYYVEIMQKITEEPAKQCPKCHQETLKRGPGGGIGLVFKGSGFYITDYKNPQDNSKNSSQKEEGGCGSSSSSSKSCGCKKGH